jgi:hypothetical protein
LGIDEQRENFWQANRRAKLVADSPHDSGLRRKTDKDICSRRTSRGVYSRIVDGESCLLGEQPQSCRRIRGTSAKSGGGGQMLYESEAT